MNPQEAESLTFDLAVKAQYILTHQVGLSYKTQEGVLGVTFDLVGPTSDLRYGIMQLDVDRVPPRVNPAVITRDDTLHQLTIMTGYRFHKLNTTGVTLCVELDTSHRRPLPKRVLLTTADRPEGRYMIPIGVGRMGPEWRSLAETNSILVGGESRGGKSTWLNAMLYALLLQEPPNSLDLTLVDPKGVEFIMYDGIPHLRGRGIATTPEDATEALHLVAEEMDRRQAMFQRMLARKLSVYNARAANLQEETLPFMVVVIDEVTDLILQASGDFNKHLTRVASKGASFGIILVLATQNPKAEVLNTLIRGNLSTRIAFRVSTHDHSRVILGVPGAEQIPRTIRGRLMARLDSELTPLQGYLVPEPWIERVTRIVRKVDGYQVKSSSPAKRTPPIKGLEREIAAHSLIHWQGFLTQSRILETFGDRISKPAVETLYQTWKTKGWLKLGKQGQPSRLTPKLIALLVQG